MSEKPYSMILGPIWSKIVFWKKKLPNLPKNTENSRFFEFPKFIKWPELADNYFKTSALPQSHFKNFFVSQTQKFMKIFQKTYPPPQKGPFFGGGKFIKCRFRQLWRSMFLLFQKIGTAPKIRPIGTTSWNGLFQKKSFILYLLCMKHKKLNK